MKSKEKGSSYFLSYTIGDALYALTSNKSQKILANIYGLVTRVTLTKTTMFTILTDGTAKIQLVSKKNEFSDSQW
ncbi:hypothetical protein JYU16_02030, partial [bacterium AH-315-M05]|nr:hypothetical protein [bacterium AH-315-M05]